MHSTAEEKEAVMADDGSEPLMEQPATAVHRTRVVFAAAVFLPMGSGVVALFVYGVLRPRNTKHRK